MIEEILFIEYASLKFCSEIFFLKPKEKKKVTSFSSMINTHGIGKMRNIEYILNIWIECLLLIFTSFYSHE